jgi:hypothetical protein
MAKSHSTLCDDGGCCDGDGDGDGDDDDGTELLPSVVVGIAQEMMWA